MNKRRLLPFVAVASALSIVGAACSGNTNGGGGGGSTASPGANLQKGGVLRVGLLSDVTASMDPSVEYYSESFALLSDMQRTLMFYVPQLGDAGDVPTPDLAAAPPTVTNNAQTWTFKLKPGVMFGPPLNRPITCADFQTAIKRMFTKDVGAPYTFYFTVIQGAEDFENGKASDISGVQCPDPNTVVFQLTQPAGDFNYRVTLPATAPMPAEAVKGHDTDYGRYLVSSACYMWQGEDQVNFSLPVKQQKPAIGYQPGKSMVLVRNPAATADSLRHCYVDEVDINIGGTDTDLYNKIQAGTLDFIDDTPSEAGVLRTFRANPTLKNQISPSFTEDATFYIAMNTTVPPFDDIHIRKAANLIMDKAALLRVRGGPDFGQVATHIDPPSMAGALPATYDPYATTNHTGDLAKAEAEVKQSKYDPGQTGQCTDPVCKDVFTVYSQDATGPAIEAAMKSSLAKIGITLKDRGLETGTMYNFYGTPAKKIAIFPTAGWIKDYADQSTFIAPLFAGSTIIPSGNVNYSMVNDPTVNTDIQTCQGKTGTDRESCWADMDKYIMENVVPWVPWRWGKNQYVYSNRIAFFSLSQFSAGSSIANIALTPQAIQAG
ncbi:MAG TPA: ABC transporter substrate-binding protein [Actinomycetota bacterium]